MDRLPIEHQIKDKTMHIQISKELDAAMHKKIKALGSSKSLFIRLAISEYLKLGINSLKNFSSQYGRYKVGKSFVFRIPGQLHEDLSHVATKLDLPLQQLVREAIERALG